MNDSQKNPQPKTFRSRRRQKQAPTKSRQPARHTPANTIKKNDGRRKKTPRRHTKYAAKNAKKYHHKCKRQIGLKHSEKQNTAQIQSRQKNAKIRSKIDRKLPRQKYENAGQKIKG